MTTATLTAPALPMNLNETLAQIGRMNVLATSGGRVAVTRTDEPGYITALELPVSSGYAVRVTLAADDTYTVERIMRRGVKLWVKGTLTGIYCDELGETVYVAGCYKNRDFGDHKVQS